MTEIKETTGPVSLERRLMLDGATADVGQTDIYRIFWTKMRHEGKSME